MPKIEKKKKKTSNVLKFSFTETLRRNSWKKKVYVDEYFIRRTCKGIVNN